MTGDALTAIGRISRAHGVHGEIRVDMFSPFPERSSVLTEVVTEEGPSGRVRHVMEARRVEGGVLLRLEGIESREKASELRGSTLWVRNSERYELPGGYFYLDDVLGIDVVTESGDSIGVLAAVLDSGAHDIYVVRDGEREHLIPAVSEFIREINVSSRRMTVRLIDGM